MTRPNVGWNYFTEDVKNQKSESEKRYDKSLEKKYKLLKVRLNLSCKFKRVNSLYQGFSMVALFLLLIAAGVTSKGATFFMVSQISPNVEQPACPKQFGSGFVFPTEATVTVAPTETEKVGWFWALFFSFIAPEVATFIWGFRVFSMKSWKYLGVVEFLIVFFFV